MTNVARLRHPHRCPHREQTLTHRADVETWRETHSYRRLQKYQRQELSGGKTATPVTSAVYDDQGNLLATP